MTITTAQQTASEQPVAPWAFFVELEFLSGTQRLCNFNKTFTWNGYDWIGLGSLGTISVIKASEKIEANSVTLTLNIAQTAWLAEGVGPVEDYRGRPVNIYQCPLTPEHTLIDDPILSWVGEMDVMAVSVDEGGSVSLRCEPPAKRLRRANALRVNAAQQKQRYPLDTGFDYQADLIANPQVWLSVNFQRQT